LRRLVVLGSEGLIGRQLCAELESRGAQCARIDIQLGPEHDLRAERCEPFLNALSEADLVYHLAFDVGGSRYLARQEAEASFIDNNTRILVNTFKYIHELSVPTIFASSQMSHLPRTSYGLLKALGERLSQAAGGSSIRLWNVYGNEEQGEKSHVVPDFVDMALRTGTITMRTAGREKRDLMYAGDAATLLADLVQSPDSPLAPGVTLDVATGTWTSIQEVAEIVAELTGASIVPGALQDIFAGNDNHDPSISDFVASRSFLPVSAGIAEIVRQSTEG
jgi:nucleoside-diphosphate-sugar epimerase